MKWVVKLLTLDDSVLALSVVEANDYRSAIDKARSQRRAKMGEAGAVEAERRATQLHAMEIGR